MYQLFSFAHLVSAARSFAFTLTLVIGFLVSPATTETRADEPDSTLAIEKGLGYVQSAGQRWRKKRGCVSCHQIPSMIWAQEAARDSSDENELRLVDEWQEWSTNPTNFVKPEQKADVDHAEALSANVDTIAALLLAIPRRTDASWRTTFVDALVKQQADDGSWNACGQLPMQRRHENETHATTTLWTSLALVQENASFRQDDAVRFADQVESPTSTEWYAARLLFADATADQALSDHQQRLLRHQNEDGGWGWQAGQPSDALGTGYALYALAKSGVSNDAIQKARSYLIRTQTETGKWIVPGTKKSAKGRPTATANDWGTAWATVALLQSETE